MLDGWEVFVPDIVKVVLFQLNILHKVNFSCFQDQGQYVVLWKQGQEVLTAGPMMVKPDPRLRYVSLIWGTFYWVNIHKWVKNQVQYWTVSQDGPMMVKPDPRLRYGSLIWCTLYLVNIHTWVKNQVLCSMSGWTDDSWFRYVSLIWGFYWGNIHTWVKNLQYVRMDQWWLTWYVSLIWGTFYWGNIYTWVKNQV
jgi:hypothetical protein